MSVLFPTFFLVAWFVFALGTAHAQIYRKALIFNVFATASFAIYAFLIGEYVATATFIIAGTNSAFQFFLPLSETVRIKIIRNLAAIVAVIIATYVLYDNPPDILLCLSVAIIRLGEAQASTRVLRWGYIIGLSFNLAFGILEDLYLMAFFQAIIMVYFAYKLYSKGPESQVS